MSSNLAYAAPLRSPSQRRSPSEERHERHLEVASTRAQRRARPRLGYALITVGSLFGLFMAQLLLSIVLADGAYQISTLQTEKRELAQTEQSLGEKIDLLSSPQNLATQAESLGMVVSNSAPQFLRLSDGAVIGTNARFASVGALGADGSRVPNALLAGTALVTATQNALTPAEGTDGALATETEDGLATGAPAAVSTPGSTPGSLPSPVTH